MTDGITQLEDDHDKVEEVFKKYEGTTDQAAKTRRQLVDQMIKGFSVHAEIEEQVLYPVSRLLSDEAFEETLESIEEHHVVKILLDELTKLDPEDERFHPKVTVLMETLRHHIEGEEIDLFPMVRGALDHNDVRDLGEALDEARRLAPTGPPPGAPDTPPANLVSDLVSSIVDRIQDRAAS